MSNRKVCLIIILVNLVLLGGGAVFIAWYSDHMVLPTFSVEQGALKAYNLTPQNHLNATFVFIVRSLNRDPKYHITYEQVVVSVYHIDGYSLSYENESPFTVEHGNGTYFTAHPMARYVVVNDTVATKIRNETISGRLELEVRVRAKLRFEVKRWKHRTYFLRAICTPVVVNFTTWKTSNRTNCNVDSFQT